MKLVHYDIGGKVAVHLPAPQKEFTGHCLVSVQFDPIKNPSGWQIP